MALKRCFTGVASASIFMIGVLLMASVPEATAETLNLKMFNHVTKAEIFPIPDVAGHVVGVIVREGAAVLESGELGWHKIIQSIDLTIGAGTFGSYLTYTFLDGSTFTARMKGVAEAPHEGAVSTAKISGEVIHGEGRFQGIKGTMTISAKVLPPEKGELQGKSLGEGILVYTVPGR